MVRLYTLSVHRVRGYDVTHTPQAPDDEQVTMLMMDESNVKRQCNVSR